MTFSLRRNSDPALPASHTVEVTFNLPADFPFGGIANVPGILMKQAEQTPRRAAPRSRRQGDVRLLPGRPVGGRGRHAAQSPAPQGAFLVRHSDRLQQWPPRDPRAEKGKPGERAFEEAFKAWEQTSANLARPPGGSSGVLAPSNPPVIKADTPPAKIVPPTTNADPPADAQNNAQGKPFQDRIGAAAAPERVVSREEQPVALPAPTRGAAPSPGLHPRPRRRWCRRNRRPPWRMSPSA